MQAGDEPRISAERGEQVEPVAPPQAGEFEGGSPADRAELQADDFFSNLSDSLDDAETPDDIGGLSPPGDDFLDDLGDLGGADADVFSGDFGLDDTGSDSETSGFDDLDFGSDLDFGGDDPTVSDESGDELLSSIEESAEADGLSFDDFDLASSDDAGAIDDLEGSDDDFENNTEGLEDFEDLGAEQSEEAGTLDGDLNDESELFSPEPSVIQEPEPTDSNLDEGDFDFSSEESFGDLSDSDDFDLDIEGDLGELSQGGDAPTDADAGAEELFGGSFPDEASAPDALSDADDSFQPDDFDVGSDASEAGEFEDFGDFGNFDDGFMSETSEASDFSDFDTEPSFSDEPADTGAQSGSSDFSMDDFSSPDVGDDIEDFGDFDGGFDSSDFGDEFSMGDFGAEFGIMDEQGAADFADEEPQQEADLAEENTDTLEAASAADEAGDFGITDEQFSTLKKSLDFLPLNVKLAAAEAVAGGEYSFEEIKPLIDALADGRPPRDIAKLVSKITGKKVEIPRGYEKRSGVSFEQERKSFAYQFRQTVWPILRLMLLGTAALAAVLYLGYQYIYQPLYANNLYVQGLDDIEVQEYQEANRLFDRAYDIWPVNQRFLDYADAFIDQRQFSFASDKYLELLSDQVEPLHREGILDYADFATYQLRDFSSAIDMLSRLLSEDASDYDARLAEGDAYLEWAKSTSPSPERDNLLEQARYDYASLMQQYGQGDELLFRMLRYFIITQNVEEAMKLKDVFLQDDHAVLDPHGMTELGGFLVDLLEDGRSSALSSNVEDQVDDYVANLWGDNDRENLLRDASLVLEKAMELDDSIPEIHYHRARFDRITENLQDEITALHNARIWYEELRSQRPLDRGETAREIDTYIREGEYLYDLGEVLSAETRFRQAVDLYQQALDARKVEVMPAFGRAYAALGDIYYYEASDYDAAYDFYRSARENEYGNPQSHPEMFRERQDIAYKMGFIELFRANSLDIDADESGVRLVNRADVARRQELLDQAIMEFNRAQGAVPTANINLLYARANTQYMRENYYDAASLYRILLDELTSERRSISTFLLDEDQRHRALIDFQIRVNNNLGVTQYRLYQQSGENDQDLLAQSQLYLSRSTELSENLVRDEETAVRADTTPLAFLNLNYILAPGFENAVQIDPDIRKDLQSPNF